MVVQPNIPNQGSMQNSLGFNWFDTNGTGSYADAIGVTKDVNAPTGLRGFDAAHQNFMQNVKLFWDSIPAARGGFLTYELPKLTAQAKSEGITDPGALRERIDELFTGRAPENIDEAESKVQERHNDIPAEEEEEEEVTNPNPIGAGKNGKEEVAKIEEPNSVYERLVQASKDAPMYAQAAQSDIPVSDSGKIYSSLNSTEEEREQGIKDYFENDEKKKKMILDVQTDKERKDPEVYKSYIKEMDKEGILTDSEIQNIVAAIQNTPANKSVLDKVSRFGTNLLGGGVVKADFPGFDNPEVYDVEAFVASAIQVKKEGYGKWNGEMAVKKFTEDAFLSAMGDYGAGLRYYKQTGDTNGNPFAIDAQKDIVASYNKYSNGEISADEFVKSVENRLDDSPLNIKNQLKAAKREAIDDTISGAGAVAGMLGGMKLGQFFGDKVAPKLLKKAFEKAETAASKETQNFVDKLAVKISKNAVKMSQALENEASKAESELLKKVADGEIKTAEEFANAAKNSGLLRNEVYLKDVFRMSAEDLERISEALAETAAETSPEVAARVFEDALYSGMVEGMNAEGLMTFSGLNQEAVSDAISRAAQFAGSRVNAGDILKNSLSNKATTAAVSNAVKPSSAIKGDPIGPNPLSAASGNVGSKVATTVQAKVEDALDKTTDEEKKAAFDTYKEESNKPEEETRTLDDIVENPTPEEQEPIIDPKSRDPIDWEKVKYVTEEVLHEIFKGGAGGESDEYAVAQDFEEKLPEMIEEVESHLGEDTGWSFKDFLRQEFKDIFANEDGEFDWKSIGKGTFTVAVCAFLIATGNGEYVIARFFKDLANYSAKQVLGADLKEIFSMMGIEDENEIRAIAEMYSEVDLPASIEATEEDPNKRQMKDEATVYNKGIGYSDKDVKVFFKSILPQKHIQNFAAKLKRK